MNKKNKSKQNKTKKVESVLNSAPSGFSNSSCENNFYTLYRSEIDCVYLYETENSYVEFNYCHLKYKLKDYNGESIFPTDCHISGGRCMFTIPMQTCQDNLQITCNDDLSELEANTYLGPYQFVQKNAISFQINTCLGVCEW